MSRALLVGLSLAELMIIVVFVLLILLSDEKQNFEKITKFENALGEEQAGVLISIVNDNPRVPHLAQGLIEKAIDLVSEEGSAPVVSEPPDSVPVSDVENQMSREELVKSLNEARAEIADLQSKNSGLSDEVLAKAGDRVICTYLKKPESMMRGRSLALGTIYVEKDGVTLISREPFLYSMPIYDYVLRPYDVSDALDVLDDWPLGKKLSAAEFGEIGAKFVAIGEKYSEERNTCKFALNYELELIEGTDNVEGLVLDMFNKVVRRYFFEGLKLKSARSLMEVGAQGEQTELGNDSWETLRVFNEIEL